MPMVLPVVFCCVLQFGVVLACYMLIHASCAVRMTQTAGYLYPGAAGAVEAGDLVGVAKSASWTALDPGRMRSALSHRA